MKQIVKISTLLSLSAVTLLASGYRIPEQSLNATALSAAYVAGANGADASYYNPANMALMGGGAEIEGALTYINLPRVEFTGVNATHSDKSLEEHFLIPTMHYVSPMMGDWRYGLSIVAPGGLSKRWDNFGKRSAEEFTLKVIEVNPTASYKVNDQLALGLGLRGLYTDGIVKSNYTALTTKRDLTGDSIDFGYNLALTFKPLDNLTFSSTYRSKVDLTVKGKASLTGFGGTTYNGGASVSVPLPASLTLASAYTMNKTTVEFVYERTYWSAYKSLDFNYDYALGGTLATFDNAVPKNWKDVNAYRIGISHQYSDALKLMAGFAIDENPVPSNTLGFELPDSDAKLYSVGFEYKLTQNTKVGLAYLYDDKESRTVSNNTGGTSTAPSGTFSDGGAHLVTASIKYKF